MKKVFSVFFALIIMFSLNIFEDSKVAAATYTDSVTLTTSLSSISTSRVSSTGLLKYNVVNTGWYSVKFRIFKDGIALSSNYIYLSPGESTLSTLSVPSTSQYSLRVYCASSTGTGCTAGASINGNP